MKIFKGMLSMFTALAMFVCAMPSVKVSATTIYGDVNNSGTVDLTDVSMLNLYLEGSVSASSINKKYADVDQNTVLDVCDLKTLKAYITYSLSNLPYSESGNTFNCNSYVFPSDSTRSYTKYNCTTGIQSTYTLNGLSNYMPRTGNYDGRQIDSSANAKSVVQLLYKDNYGQWWRGSGFIVDKHTIATCAHCIYNGTSFNTDYTIKIYDTNGSTLLNTLYAKELHVPSNYISSSSTYYDYGLIYVDSSLSSYGNIALGTATDYFMSTSSDLSISGFPAEVSGLPVGSVRYYETGEVLSSSNDYMIHSTAYNSGGDSGGPMYIEYSLNGTTFRSAIGICRGFISASPYNDRYSHGVRITTPVLRFYMDNDYINSAN
ncbi:MAG: trypsin-like serine protease [Oscillospiraceae bacterium]|nr:trypsin-like serine protease [Oscillospiraceae bacterium]